MRLRNRLLVAAAVPTILLFAQVIFVTYFIHQLQSAVTFISSAHAVIEADFEASELVNVLRKEIKRLPTAYSGLRNGAVPAEHPLKGEFDRLESLISKIANAPAAQQIERRLVDAVARAASNAARESAEAAAAAASDTNDLNGLFEHVIASDRALGALAEALSTLSVELRKEQQIAVDREAMIHNRPIIAGVAIGGVSVLLMLAFAWLYVDRRLAAQLIALSKSMREIARGNLKARLPTSSARDEIGDMVDALTVFRDTAVEVEEKNLREVASAQQRLIDAIESISEGFALWDKNDRLIMYNSRWKSLLNLAEVSAVGTRFEDLIRELVLKREYYDVSMGDRDAWLAQRLALHRNVPSEFEQVLIGGTWLRVSEYPTQEAGRVTVWTDITALKQRESDLAGLVQKLEVTRDQALQATQAKSQFLASMSHELRTPLNAIIGFTRLVMRRAKNALPAQQYQNLEKILSSSEHLLALINSVLDLSKIEAGRMDLHMSQFPLGSLLDTCLATVEPLVKADRVQLIKDVSGPLPVLETDQDKIKQILINLLSNAIKFTEQGSITLHAQQRGQQIELAVADTGIGIPTAELEAVFEDFRQVGDANRARGGTGLGLAISRRFARMLGGNITVTSKEGHGSTFTVMLPLSRTANMPESPSELLRNSESNAVSDSAERLVLAIDDDPNVVYLLKENLADAGYRVVGASSGEEGLELARKLRPKAITLDIIMPVMDGWQVLHTLKSDPATRHIPVILVSVADPKDLGFRLGAADYVVKPFDRDSLIGAMRRIAPQCRRILVVDDDSNVPDLVRQSLEGENYTVEWAADGIAALEHIAQVRPSLILLDLLMPRMDGLAFLDVLYSDAALRDIPVIVLTAKLLNAGERQMLQERVRGLVEKHGFSREDLVKEVRRVLAASEPINGDPGELMPTPGSIRSREAPP
jgi:signal transduction histidine kinase/DNA-binding response OmpR family regulator/HAMP domain-containing protein